MSKIVSKKILSLIIFFLIVLILLFTGYKILSDGFYIKSIKLGKLNIDTLYLKLDNKLILDINKLDISAYLKPSKKQSSSSIESFTEKIKYGIWAISYFQKLSIKEIILDKEGRGSVIYDGAQYKIAFPNLQADFAISNNDKSIQLKILKLILSNIGIQTDGNIVYFTQNRSLNFNLILSPTAAKDNLLYLQGITNLKTITLQAKSSEIKDLQFLEPYVEKIQNPALKQWLFEKIKFSSLQLNTANIKASLNKNNFLSSLLQNASLKATIKNPRVYLESNLEPITAKQATIKLEKQNISMDMQSPSYDNTDLEGSSLLLTHLLESPKLSVKIISQTAHYNQALQALLNAYNITLPIENVQSPIHTDLELSLQFLQESEPIIGLKGTLHTQESNFSLYHIPLYTQDAHISLDITSEYEYVYIDTTHTRYQNIADLDTNITLDLKAHNLHMDTAIHKLQLSTNNDINTAPYSPPLNAQEPQEPQKSQEPNPQNPTAPLIPARTSDTDTTHTSTEPIAAKESYQTPPSPTSQSNAAALLKRKIIDAIKAQGKEKFTKNVFYADQDNLPTLSFDLDFSNPDTISLHIPELQIQGDITDQSYTFKLNDLSKLYPFSPLMQYLSIKAGSIDVTTSDFSHFNFEVYLSALPLPLYQKDGKKLDEIAISGKITPEEISATSSDRNITFSAKDNQNHITIKNLNFNLDEFFNSPIPAVQEIFAPSSAPKLTQKQLEEKFRFIREKQKYERLHDINPYFTALEVDNTRITYKNYQIPLENANLMLRDGKVSADGTYKNGILNLDILDGNIFVRANNFSGDFINKVMRKNIINGGLYTLIGAYRDGVFNGELKLQNTLFKDFALVQNLINLIDTIPSLIVFKNPNLGTEGYEIQKGSIIFAINSKYIGFERIDLIGQSMDILGNGIIELGSDEINMNLSISTIKNFSNIINKIPVVGYLILGKEGKISTNVIINGTLENPQTKITLAEDAIKAPFNILRRVFTPIDIIVNEIKNEMK
ncbi:hypothetical protein BKH46_06405 [Helicobacter sp. 12S02634-8]|uniref:DUF3971 domain-containing protein n=1 Tax=Helicobacter sp. 12S02634-8 TaxID=1476199 RepID=UPI000BA4EA0F|nr:DUF3971 domain-containing protein [Helicobacter sp. 12S02634-8]PAF46842.1 hypothetical protein BKH46_06405 [Helicobacter sp. 12S02634-8]